MQKKLIALAIAAAFSAPAFADVQVYGLLDAAVANLSADGQKSDMQAVSGGLSTSRVGLNSAEDLGNGMKAIVNLEYSLDAQTSSTLVAARQQLLGVAGDFGTVATGYLQTTAWDFQNTFDPTSGSTVSPLGNVTKGGKFLIGSVAYAARAQRALAYISPNMGGATVAVNYSTGLDGLGDLTVANSLVQSKSTAYLLSVNYTGVQNLALGLVYVGATLGTSSGALGTGALTAETSTLSANEVALGASYDFGVAKLFATYQKRGNGTNNVVTHDYSNKAESISAVIPAGPGAVALSYAKNSMDTNGGANASAKGETVAYLYSLSKTDTVYFAYSKMSQDIGTSAYSVDNNALAASTAAGWTSGGGSSTELAVGLRKKF